MKNSIFSSRNGSVLILSIWTLMFLTIFAAIIGLRVRTRMGVLARLEDRSRQRYAAEAGIKKAMAAIRFDEKRHPLGLDAAAKSYRYNNPGGFERVVIDNGAAEVSHDVLDVHRQKHRFFGVVDEERKININTVDRATLLRLFQEVTSLSTEEARSIVEAIVNWREIGNTELAGFASDEYYLNLPRPYPNKNAPFELYEELLLVRGMNERTYEEIRPFITIYGDGLVNVNTASQEVLVALGLDAAVAQKLLKSRRGPDGLEATGDDHIFRNAYDVAREMQDLVELQKEEIIAIDFLNAAGKIKPFSHYYSIRSIATTEGKAVGLEVNCVYNVRDNVIEYWREKI